MMSIPQNTLTARDGSPLWEAENWIFDLDNTLYPASCRLFDQVDKNITQFIMQFLDLDWDEAYAIQKSYFRRYGTSMNGLMKIHGADPIEFLEFVHNIDLSHVARNPRMDEALTRLPGRKVIFTNGSVKHAERIIDALGVTHHFESIFDIVAADFRPKPNQDTYETCIQKYSINPNSAVMVEDMAQNLTPANKLGMTCVWVASDTEWARTGYQEGHVHHIINDLTTWLELITKK